MANENQVQEASGEQAAPSPITADSFKSAGVPESYFKDGNYDLSTIGKDLGAYATMRAADEARRAAIPESADKYDLNLPKEFKGPEGYQWNLGERAKPVTEWAHKHGIPQSALSELAQLEATYQVSQINAAKQQYDEAVASLGPNAKTLLKNLSDSMKGHFGDELAGVLSQSITDKKSFDAMLTYLNGKQTHASRANGHDETKPDISKMSARQRLDYANSQKAKH